MNRNTSVPESLADFFRDHPKCALAFSGGTDSAYLLYAAKESGCDAVPYLVRTAFMTEDEIISAVHLADSLGLDLHILNADVLGDPEITKNPHNRCYLCKKKVFGTIIAAAEEAGIDLIIDGSNTSDDPAERPGMKALEELGIVSPLRVCGLSKPEIRELSKAAGLSTWHMPSNSCSATRIPYGTPITGPLLNIVEECESSLRGLGFSGFRVRTDGQSATLEILPEQNGLLELRKDAVEDILLKYHSSVSYGVRRSGP